MSNRIRSRFRAATLGEVTAFNPLSLFAESEQGWLYDATISDLSGLFQDSAGTIPVTAVEQPVGLMLDTSKGLALGSELVTNGDFPTNTTGWSACPDNAGSPTFTSVSGTGHLSASNGNAGWNQSFTTVIGQWYKVAGTLATVSGTPDAIRLRKQDNNTIAGATNAVNIAVAAATASGYFIATSTTTYIQLQVNMLSGTAVVSFDNISCKSIAGNHATQATSAARPTLSARYNLLLATTTLSTQNVTTVATNYTLRFTGAGSITLSGTGSGTYNAGSHTVTCMAGTLTLTVSGTVTDADLRPANDGVSLPVYQRVNTATDYDTTGFPLYLRFDGSDDFMVTGSINFTATDKMSLFAGVRKTNDTVSIIAELSTSYALANPGSMFLVTGTSPTAADRYSTSSRGSASPQNGHSAYDRTGSAPESAVLVGTHDIAGNLSTISRNGVAGTSGIAVKGTGNFGNYPLYIGRRAGTSLPFNGRIYFPFVGLGRLATAGEVTNMETFLNTRNKVY